MIRCKSRKRELIAAALLWGCGARALPAPAEPDRARLAARWPNVTVAQLQAGQQLCAQRCGACHQLYEPASQSAQRWPEVVREMKERAKLDDGQEQLVLQYLIAITSRTEPDLGRVSANSRQD